jgi:hypothetical protein
VVNIGAARWLSGRVYACRVAAGATIEDMPDGPLPDKWYTRDYPVLLEVARRIDSGEEYPAGEQVGEALGMTAADVRLAAHALARRDLVAINEDYGGGVTFEDVAGAAYLMTGLHPDTDDALSRLVVALQQAADQVSDEEERSRLRRAADGLLNVSREVMVGVMTAYLAGQLPR